MELVNSMQSTSLFDRYADSPSGSPTRRFKVGHMQTKTSALRATGVRLACYLNTEVNRARSTIIHLPEECDTMGEVLPKIQASMKLDKRMKYVAELFLPDGEKIHTFQQLTNAAYLNTAIIVGCGEPFDPSSVPYDILEFHMHGGGRGAALQVKKGLAERKLIEAHDKADTVRASGHGLDSIAAMSSRIEKIESNREQAASMRHEYMEQLMFRASQQRDLVDRVRENNEIHKLEHRASKQRRKEMMRDRLDQLASERENTRKSSAEKKAKVRARIMLYHNKIKSDYQNSAHRLRQQRLARIAAAGSQLEVKL